MLLHAILSDIAIGARDPSLPDGTVHEQRAPRFHAVGDRPVQIGLLQT
jgi:hypothetical protein